VRELVERQQPDLGDHHVSASARTPSATDWWCAVTVVAEAPPTIIGGVRR